MDSITHIKLLYQVLPWLWQGSPFGPGLQQSACQQRALSSQACRRMKAPVGAGPTLSPPSEAQPRAAPGRCHVPNYSSSCSQGPSGQRGKVLFTARAEGKDKESNKGGLQDPGAQEEEERIVVGSKLFAAVHRKREGVGGERGPAAQQSRGGTGQWGTCPALCPVQPELALQPAILGGG